MVEFNRKEIETVTNDTISSLKSKLLYDQGPNLDGLESELSTFQFVGPYCLSLVCRARQCCAILKDLTKEEHY